MDRIARLEVWSVLAHDFGLYGIVTRLEKMGFKPSPMLKYSSLDEDQQLLYKLSEPKARRTNPYDSKIAVWK